QVEQRFVWPGGGGLPAGVNVELNGKGTAVGFNVSMLYSPLLNADQLPIANIAFIYRSQATMPLQGTMMVNGATIADARSTLVLPQMYTAAFAVWPIRDRSREWKLEMDIDYVGWKSVRNTDVQLSTGGVIPQPQNWRTVPTVSVGTEYKLLHPELLPNWNVAFRGGWTYTQTQVPDATFNPGVPSLNSHTLGTGIGLMCYQGGKFFGVIPCGRESASSWMPQAIGVDVSSQVWFYESRTIQGNQNPTVNGTYTAALYLGAVSLRLLF
ncbi:MAG: outer membrane protein transport protein, partial [Nitrospira sp.]